MKTGIIILNYNDYKTTIEMLEQIKDYKTINYIIVVDNNSVDNSYEILTQLLKSNPKNEVALDYMLCSLLQKKDLENFKLNYDLYCTERPRIRKLYQEALCIWLISENATENEWHKYIKDEQVRSRLKDYMVDRANPAFEDTYWYYFDFFNLNGN